MAKKRKVNVGRVGGKLFTRRNLPWLIGVGIIGVGIWWWLGQSKPLADSYKKHPELQYKVDALKSVSVKLDNEEEVPSDLKATVTADPAAPASGNLASLSLLFQDDDIMLGGQDLVMYVPKDVTWRQDDGKTVSDGIFRTSTMNGQTTWHFTSTSKGKKTFYFWYCLDKCEADDGNKTDGGKISDINRPVLYKGYKKVINFFEPRNASEENKEILASSSIEIVDVESPLGGEDTSSGYQGYNTGSWEDNIVVTAQFLDALGEPVRLKDGSIPEVKLNVSWPLNLASVQRDTNLSGTAVTARPNGDGVLEFTINSSKVTNNKTVTLKYILLPAKKVSFKAGFLEKEFAVNDGATFRDTGFNFRSVIDQSWQDSIAEAKVEYAYAISWNGDLLDDSKEQYFCLNTVDITGTHDLACSDGTCSKQIDFSETQTYQSWPRTNTFTAPKDLASLLENKPYGTVLLETIKRHVRSYTYIFKLNNGKIYRKQVTPTQQELCPKVAANPNNG